MQKAYKKLKLVGQAKGKHLTDLFLPLLNLIWQCLDIKSRARMATTCKFGKQALLKKAWSLTTELDLTTNQGMNIWLQGVLPELPPCSHLKIPFCFFMESKWQGLLTPSLIRLECEDSECDPHQFSTSEETLIENLNQMKKRLPCLTSLQQLTIPPELLSSVPNNLKSLTIQRGCFPTKQSLSEFYKMHFEHPSLTQLELVNLTMPMSLRLPNLRLLTINVDFNNFYAESWGNKLNAQTVPSLQSLEVKGERSEFFIEEEKLQLVHSLTSFSCCMSAWPSHHIRHCPLGDFFLHAQHQKESKLECLTVRLYQKMEEKHLKDMELLFTEALVACPRLWKLLMIWPHSSLLDSSKTLATCQQYAGDQWIVTDTDVFFQRPTDGKRILILKTGA
jgi:hypothetical protein